MTLLHGSTRKFSKLLLPTFFRIIFHVLYAWLQHPYICYGVHEKGFHDTWWTESERVGYMIWIYYRKIFKRAAFWRVALIWEKFKLTKCSTTTMKMAVDTVNHFSWVPISSAWRVYMDWAGNNSIPALCWQWLIDKGRHCHHPVIWWWWWWYGSSTTWWSFFL